MLYAEMVLQVRSLGCYEYLLGRIFVVDGSGYGAYKYRLTMPSRHLHEHIRILVI